MGEPAVAPVTGASRGVGRGVAEAFGEIGAHVWLTGRDERALAETAGAVETLGGRATAFPCDHRDDARVEALFGALLARHGRLDVLVNSAWGGYESMVEGGEFTWPRPF
jgi:NAD(P)-dependent dehydrogenase (short-subunit alcohol dehydrogenase family)